MSRAEGFDRLDLSTSIVDDPKFRTLARRHPELYGTALAAYVGLLCLSWREGERLTLEEAWPTLLPFDDGAVAAMVDVGLVDSETRPPNRAWEAWFGAAAERRRLGRERQKRADVKRGRVRSSDSQSGSSAGPSDSQSVSQSGPPPDQQRSNVGVDDTTCPGCGELVLPSDLAVVAGPRGQLRHRKCPVAA